jgi:uncharacterized protein
VKAVFTRFVALLFALWLLPGALHGCAPVKRQQSAAAVSQVSESAQHPVFMWRVASDSAVVHLLGSIHVGTKEMYPLDPRIEQAFTAADTLVLEIDLDEEAEAEAALAFVEMALLPKDQTISDLLDEETLKLLQARLLELGIPFENVEMFRPWFVGLTIEMKALEQRGYSGEYGIDQHFRARALNHKEILELESVQEQAALFASLTAEGQVDDLRMTLEGNPEEANLEALTAEWLLGKSDLIAAELATTRVDYPEAYEALYAGRNRKMVEKIEGYLKTSKRYFVVAGGAHMVGADGIVELLRARGRQVVQQ